MIYENMRASVNQMQIFATVQGAEGEERLHLALPQKKAMQRNLER